MFWEEAFHSKFYVGQRGRYSNQLKMPGWWERPPGRDMLHRGQEAAPTIETLLVLDERWN